MDMRRCKVGLPVWVTVTGVEAEAGETGFIHTLRGWNYERGRKASRWLHVWITRRPDGSPTRRGVSLSSNEVEEAL
jgi:hypothetical protein